MSGVTTFGSAWEKITFVPTVKAYPAMNSTGTEVVCVAGFRLGVMEQPRWIRLFPVTFRELDQDKKFKKWEKLQIEVKPNARDRRPESRLPNAHSIELLTQVKPKDREDILAGVEEVSMCELQARQKENGTSLGLVRPGTILDFKAEQRAAEEVAKQQMRVNEAAGQLKLIGPQLTPLEVLPHVFRYSYRCDEEGCTVHHQSIIDWEVSAAYRKWRYHYDDVVQAIQNKWLNELCGAGRHVRFYAGNMHQHPQSFLVLGVHSRKV